MASYANIPIALVKDEAYVSSGSHNTEYSEPLLCTQPLRIYSNKGLIGLNYKEARSEFIRPEGLHEYKGMAAKSSVKSVNPASKASFAERCRELMASYDSILSLRDDDEDEINQRSEFSDNSPLLPRSPTELLGDNDQMKPTELFGDNGQLRPPSELLGYDGKRRPAKVLGYESKKSCAAEFLEDDGQSRSPTELLRYDGRKRSPAGLPANEDKMDCRTELLRGDICEGRKSHPPPRTWVKIKKRKAVASKKTGPGMTGTSRISDEEKANEINILPSALEEQSLSSLVSDIPKQSKFTQGSLKIEVKFRR